MIPKIPDPATPWTVQLRRALFAALPFLVCVGIGTTVGLNKAGQAGDAVEEVAAELAGLSAAGRLACQDEEAELRTACLRWAWNKAVGDAVAPEDSDSARVSAVVAKRLAEADGSPKWTGHPGPHGTIDDMLKAAGLVRVPIACETSPESAQCRVGKEAHRVIRRQVLAVAAFQLALLLPFVVLPWLSPGRTSARDRVGIRGLLAARSSRRSAAELDDPFALGRWSLAPILIGGLGWVFAPEGIAARFVENYRQEMDPRGYAYVMAPLLEDANPIALGFIGFLLYALVQISERFRNGSLSDATLSALAVRGAITFASSVVISQPGFNAEWPGIIAFGVGVFPEKGLLWLKEMPVSTRTRSGIKISTLTASETQPRPRWWPVRRPMAATCDSVMRRIVMIPTHRYTQKCWMTAISSTATATVSSMRRPYR